MNTKIVAFLIAILGFFAVLWFNSVIETRTHVEKQNNSQSLPDYYVNEFYILGADKFGNPKYRLSAKRMEHIAADNHADLIEPKMKFYPDDQSAPWYVSAQTGRIDKKGELITLYGKVTILRRASALNLPVTIDTRDISFSPLTNLVKTDQKVVYTSKNSFARGIGLEADLSKQIITLKRKAKANYVPEKSTQRKKK